MQTGQGKKIVLVAEEEDQEPGSFRASGKPQDLELLTLGFGFRDLGFRVYGFGFRL